LGEGHFSAQDFDRWSYVRDLSGFQVPDEGVRLEFVVTPVIINIIDIERFIRGEFEAVVGCILISRDTSFGVFPVPRARPWRN
jgi:hypothetical protein